MKQIIASLFLLCSASIYGANCPPKIAKDIKRACDDADFPFPHLIAAIAERESDYGVTLDKNFKGDRGNGYGLFQIDQRYHSEFLRKNNWKDTYTSARYVIKLLISNYKQTKDLTGMVAAYNCGATGAKRGRSKGSWDTNTTGKDYAKDVWQTAQRLALQFYPEK